MRAIYVPKNRGDKLERVTQEVKLKECPRTNQTSKILHKRDTPLQNLLQTSFESN